MKILLLKNSILFLKINPKKDTARCFFVYFIAFGCTYTHKHTFNLSELPAKGIKLFYENLANDSDRKYRV